MHREITGYSEILPFIPKHTTLLICQEKLRIYWYESDFSQSRYNYLRKIYGSHACTLIAVLIAANCYKIQLRIGGPSKKLDKNLTFIIACGILNGNELYGSLSKHSKLETSNLTVPEAIKYSGAKGKKIKEWKSLIFMQPLLQSLYINLNAYWEEWKKGSALKKYPNLYVILICDSRSILFIFDYKNQTVALIDTHHHSSEKGAALAMVDINNLRCLCTWLTHIILKYYHDVPSLYELSFLYFPKVK